MPSNAESKPDTLTEEAEKCPLMVRSLNNRWVSEGGSKHEQSFSGTVPKRIIEQNPNKNQLKKRK